MSPFVQEAALELVTIGENSCKGVGSACAGLGKRGKATGQGEPLATVDVGANSCHEAGSCSGFQGDSIGDSSCWLDRSCAEAVANIGNDSCTEKGSCLDLVGSVGDHSCKTHLAYARVIGDIGHMSCTKPFGQEPHPELGACAGRGNIGDCVDATELKATGELVVSHKSLTYVAEEDGGNGQCIKAALQNAND